MLNGESETGRQSHQQYYQEDCEQSRSVESDCLSWPSLYVFFCFGELCSLATIDISVIHSLGVAGIYNQILYEFPNRISQD